MSNTDFLNNLNKLAINELNISVLNKDNIIDLTSNEFTWWSSIVIDWVYNYIKFPLNNKFWWIYWWIEINWKINDIDSLNDQLCNIWTWENHTRITLRWDFYWIDKY